MPANLGEVEITLNGRREVLRCSLRAARTVSLANGGFTGAFEGLARFNFSAYTALIAAGLNKQSAKEVEELQADLYATGLQSLDPPLTRFVTMLMNGGREPETAPDEGDKSGNV